MGILKLKKLIDIANSGANDFQYFACTYNMPVTYSFNVYMIGLALLSNVFIYG